MKARRLLALAILAIAFGCEGHQSPTAPSVVKSVPLDSTAVLSDGAHGGNPDFYFLPPLVPFPRTTNFEIGKFNSTLKPGLTVEICQLEPEYNALNVAILPLPTTNCVAGGALTTFAAGSVQLVKLPLRQWGWWTAFNLPPDGFYYVLWDTRPQPGQPALLNNKYYRIKVFVGSNVPMGYADVDPMSNLREWKYSLTGQVIQLVNGWMLPIPFRIQNGALCGGATSCTSETVSNKNRDGSGSTVVKVIGNDGFAIAGAKFPDGWLGPDPTSHVVVTISSVNTGPDKPDGTVGTRCHATLDLQQFRSCFKFTTTPLPFIGNTRKQFYVPVTVAVCYRLQGTGDPRAKFAEMYASNAPTEAPHALTEASDEGILGVPDRNCGSNRYGLRSSNPLIQLASAGWDKVKGGLGRVFGVKTAYAVDGGLGGFLDAFSFVGPALTAQIEAYPNPEGTTHLLTLVSGVATASARIVGNHQHHGDGAFGGIDRVPVTFIVDPTDGTLAPLTGESPPNTVADTTSTLSIPNVEGPPTLVPGIASVHWIPPSAPGTYHMKAEAPATGGPVIYSVTVPQPPAVSLGVLQGLWVNPTTPPAPTNVRYLTFNVDGDYVAVYAEGRCTEPNGSAFCPWDPTSADVSRWASDREITSIVSGAYWTKTMTVKYIAIDHIHVTTVTHFTGPAPGVDYIETDYTTEEDLFIYH